MNEPQRVVLVSGASRGIGAAAARGLGRPGTHVVVNYRNNAEAAKDVVRAIESAGGSAEPAQCDVCDENQVTGLVDLVRREHGRVDVLVCNANTVHPPFERITTIPWSRFAGKVTGELAGAFFLTQQVLPLMRAQRAGRIVYVSSIDADMVGVDAAHSVAKGALNIFSRHIASEAAQFGITVNTVAPGGVSTDANAEFMTDDVRHFLSKRSVFNRVLEPDDLGRLIALVADGGFGAATGQIIRADGGLDVLGQRMR